MTEIADDTLRAISQLRADVHAMREEIRPIAGRLEIIEAQYAEIIVLLTALKNGAAPMRPEFISKRG
jgi:hypothetical protein